MSKQTINMATRHAMWLAHKRVCRYCNEPLSFGELDIDHVIPESAASNALTFEALKKTIGLPLDFDVHSFENLLPAHRRCNRVKSARVLNPGAAVLFLELAADVSTTVRDLIEARRSHDSRESALADLSSAIQGGLLMPADFLEHSGSPEAVTLSTPLVFADGIVHSVTPEQVEALLDRPVLILGNPESFAGFGDAGRELLQVRNCREYRAALAAGFYARTSYDMKCEAFLKVTNAVLSAIETVRVPTLSYINKPFRGIADLDLLPVSLLPRVSPEDREWIDEMVGLSLGDLLSKGEIKVLSASSHEISIEWRWWGLMLRELCRADLNADGIEDILCECYCWATDGALGVGWLALLSRFGTLDQFTAILV